MINDTKEELKLTKTFTQKAAEMIGDALVNSANGSKGVCAMLGIGEPSYPISLLKQELND